MGCHTWFYRPITKSEFEQMKENAPFEIEKYCSDDKFLHDQLMKSYNENLPCAYGRFWWQLGWGLPEGVDSKVIDGKLYVGVEEYHDTFRVKHYPKANCHNKYELRKFMKSRYFTLTPVQHFKISEFFKKYPGGIINFG